MLTRSMGTVAGAGLLAAALLTGCGGSQAPATAPAAGNAPAAGSGPVQPKVNRLVLSVPPADLEGNDPRHLGVPTMWPLRPMYEYVIALNPETDKPVPQLTTKWSLEPDGVSYRFQLQKGVQFHGDNGEFTAKDLVHSFRDTIKDDSQNTQYVPYFKKLVKDVEVVNDYEAVYRLTGPDANFLRAMSEAEGGMEIRSKAHYDKLGAPTMQTGPIAGTGPYQFKERGQATFIRYERTPFKHWRATPDFPEFEFRFIKESSTRMAALLAGEVHVTSIPQDLLVQAEAQGMKVVKGRAPGLRSFFTFFGGWLADTKDASKGYLYPESPAVNPLVRKALNKAIDRDTINKAIHAGKGERVVLNHFHPSRQGWNPDWEKRYQDEYGYEPAKAKDLLTQAGYTGGKQLELNVFLESVPFFAGAEDIIEATAGYWRAIGAKVNLVTMDQNQIEAQRRDLKLPNQIRIRGTSSAQMLGTITWNSSVQNRSAGGLEDAEVDRLVAEVIKTLDEKKQDELWRKIGDLLFERHLSMPLFWLPAEAVYNPKFVSDYVGPGSISGTWSHVENIKAAR